MSITVLTSTIMDFCTHVLLFFCSIVIPASMSHVLFLYSPAYPVHFSTRLDRSEKGDQIGNLRPNTYHVVKNFVKIDPVNPEIICLKFYFTKRNDGVYIFAYLKLHQRLGVKKRKKENKENHSGKL